MAAQEKPAWPDNVRTNPAGLLCGTITALFIPAYFAFNYDSDPLSCLADTENYKNTQRLTKAPATGNYEDVGETFRFGFTWIFYLSSVYYVGIVINHLVYNNVPLRSFFAFFWIPALLISFGMWIYLYLARYSF